MDDTQHSRVSDATATRKRRSSILKNHRPPRAPLSELEFNVATPTDTAKSRRVSFSKRTGVAEFVTNEATTTWKNVYEEHNKSLESSGNDSAANPPRPSAGYLGKRIFEVQFQEVEAIDFGSTTNDNRCVETSMNNVKFDQFTLERTMDDKKLSVPGQNFEFSTFTVSEQPSKVFGDDLAISGLGEVTDNINANFSIMQPLRDDLDEIQRDLKRHQANSQNIMCIGPQNGRNMSGYIEVDLNVTQSNLGGHAECLLQDMSITDTIHSPRVNVSKNNITGQTDKSINKDWVADKENIAVNPYVAPKESTNFAINEEPDKILVFDGKRLTFQSEKQPILDFEKTFISDEQPVNIPQRKTIVLNVDDDLPNFVANPHTSISQHFSNVTMNKTVLGNDCDISMTQPVLNTIKTNSEKSQTIVFEDISGNISMTQVLPTNIVPQISEKRKTIVFDNELADISVTSAVPANVIIVPELSNEITSDTQNTKFEDNSGNISMMQNMTSDFALEKPEKRKTIMFDNELADISVTQAVPASIIISKQHNVRTEKRNTIVFEKEACDISLTQSLPTNMILAENVESVTNINVIGSDASAIMQALPHSDLVIDSDKRKTLVLSIEDINIPINKVSSPNVLLSETSSNVLLSEMDKQLEKALDEKDVLILSIPPTIPEPEKRKTIVFEEEDGNISLTKSIPSNLILPVQGTCDIQKRDSIGLYKSNASQAESLPSNFQTLVKEQVAAVDDLQYSSKKSVHVSQKRKITIAYDSDNIDVSMTQVLPSVIISSEKRISSVNQDVSQNISFTQAVPANLILPESISIVCKEEYNTNEYTNMLLKPKIMSDSIDISTKILPMQATLFETSTPELEHQKHTEPIESEPKDMSVTEIVSKSIHECDKLSTIEDRKTNTVHSNSSGDISINVALPENCISGEASSFGNDKFKDRDLQTLTPNNSEIIEKFDNNEAKAAFMTEDKKETQNKPADISMTDLEDKVQGAQCNQMINCLNTKDLVYHDAQNLQTQKENVELTELITPQIHIQEKNDSEKNIFTDNTCSRNLMVFRATTTSVRAPMSVLSTISSSTENVELQVEPVLADAGNVINTDYVTVTHNMPIPATKTDYVLSDIDRNQYNPCCSIISDVKIAFVNTDSSVSTSSPDFNEDVVHSTSTNNLCPDTNFGLTKSKASDYEIQSAMEKSLLSELLDMNDRSYSGVIDKSVTALILNTNNQNDTKPELKTTLETDSSDLFYITKDSDHETQTDKSDEDKDIPKNPANHNLTEASIIPHPKNQSPLQIKFENCVEDLEKKLLQLHHHNDVTNKASNRYYEKVVRADKNDDTELKRKSYRDADSTKDLLEMLSKFTEKEEEDNPIKPFMGKNLLVQENKVTSVPEPVVALPRRKSVVLSREDMMNNISMAQAILQHSVGTEAVDSELTFDTSPEKTPSPKKNVGLSTEVVKTLRFEDDDSSTDPKDCATAALTDPKDCGTAVLTDPKDCGTAALTTPLKKTAFGETSYMTENYKKGRVIPTYLKDVSDGVKALMNDLVKPMADVLPFESGNKNKLKHKTSTCNTSIQANLAASSQIDLDHGSSSFLLGATKMLKGIIKQSGENSDSSITHSLSDRSLEIEFIKTAPNLIQFDPVNPLNNVLLSPINLKSAHKYQPLPEGTSAPHINRISNVSFKDLDSIESDDIINAQYNIHSVIPDYFTQLNNHVSLKKTKEVQTAAIATSTSISNTYNPSTTDQKVSTNKSCLVDEGINTAIAMQDNKKLLEDISSLTLVDSTLEVEPCAVKFDVRASETASSTSVSQNSSTSCDSTVHVIYSQVPNQCAKLVEDVMHSEAEDKKSVKKKNYDKRKYKKCTLSVQDVTPKPASKIQKRSRSPVDLAADNADSLEHWSNTETDTPGKGVRQSLKLSYLKKEKSPKKSPLNKPGANAIVQHVIADYSKGMQAPQEARRRSECEAAPEGSSDSSLSRASSTSRDDSGDGAGLDTEGAGAEADWRPELVHELSSKALVAGSDPAADVARCVRLLPFMGSSECAWESESAGEWVFALLHARVRLRVRLRPARGAVCARAPVLGLHVEPAGPAHEADSSKKNVGPGVVCVRLLCEALRHVTGAGCARAGLLPHVLRRAAALARTAARWGRAMSRARRRLAYHLTADGCLTLTVANFPLQSVWEMKLRIELVLDADREMPWPQAVDVRVTPVEVNARVSEEEVRRAADGVPRDWGHVPRTLWKVFRYLKNRPSDEALLSGLPAGPL